MKHFIYLLGLLFISINGYSQLQYFLPRENSYMSVTDRRFVFDGDTIINDLRYTKVFHQYGWGENESDPDFTDPEYYAAVREDTIGGKIYCIQTNDGVERLLADFNVNPGDKVTVYSFDPYLSWEYYPQESIVEIESVGYMEINGEMRKRIGIVNEYYEKRDFWIEGIGSIYGLFSPVPKTIGIADVAMPILLCIHIGGELFWQNPKYAVCFMKASGGGITEINKSKISIYPTLVSDILQIRADGAYYYKIYSMQGSPVLSGVLNGELNLSDFNSGLYLIAFYDEKYGLIDKKKFIKI